MRQSDFNKTLYEIWYVTNLTQILIQLHTARSKRDIKVKPETDAQAHDKG